jgi:RimJ/RimL family protein N-acetyltransferase
MHVEPVTLVGRAIRMEPLEDRHAEDLLEASEPSIFAYMLIWPRTMTPEGFREYVRTLLAIPEQHFMAMVEQETGRAVGMSSYMDVRPQHRGLEIGSTWIGPAYQNTAVNPESKCLMLRHAFETLGAVRVQLKTDGRNVQSQAAIAKLGAKHEGVLRRHIILPDGFIRDTVMYSITDEEWPGVREGLTRRLGYTP